MIQKNNSVWYGFCLVCGCCQYDSESDKKTCDVIRLWYQHSGRKHMCVEKIKSRSMNDSNAMILMNVGNEHSNQDFIRKAKKAF